MKYINEHFIPLLLSILSILLVISMPAGLIENRDFTHISPEALSAYNTFLSLLVVGSLVLGWYTFNQSVFALMFSVLIGLIYVSVHLLDLLGIFPVTSMHLSDIQFFTKTLGLFVAVLLMIYAGQAFKACTQQLYTRLGKTMGASTFMLLSLIISSTFIVSYASYVTYASN